MERAGRFSVLRRPSGGSRTERPVLHADRSHRTGRQHKATTKGHIECNFLLWATAGEGDWPSTVRWTEHGASRRLQSEHHSYARTSAGETPPWQPHPAVPRGRRANGSEGGAAPAVLGVKTVRRRCVSRRTARTGARDSQRPRGAQASEGNNPEATTISRVVAWATGGIQRTGGARVRAFDREGRGSTPAARHGPPE